MITAEQANNLYKRYKRDQERKRAQSVYENYNLTEKELEDMIKLNSSAGYNSVICQNKAILKPIIIDKLKSLGYRVYSVEQTYHEPHTVIHKYMVIAWEDITVPNTEDYKIVEI